MKKKVDEKNVEQVESSSPKVVARDGDYKNLLDYISSHNKKRVFSLNEVLVSQAQINLTNPKYLLAEAESNGTLYKPKEEDYADQSMIDNNDFYGSVMDNLQADIDGINEGKFSKTKEKTEKKENSTPQQASENNSQGSSEGGQG